MSFLNLSFPEFAALFSAMAGVVVALYLLDRSKRRQIVATLRFWNAAVNPTKLKHRRRIQQPWSLLLQIVSMMLLLLAIAQLQWGILSNSGRDHVLILDTSAWMGARSRQGSLIDEARAQARAYVKALPSADRVMLVRADALATPATHFESDHRAVEQAINQSRPSASALNMTQALDFARQAQKMQARRGGEIVYVGAGRIPEQDAAIPAASLPNLRVLPINGTLENTGLRKIGLRRSPTDPESWLIFVTAKNYGAQQRAVQVALRFGGAAVGSKTLILKPGAEEEASFTWHTRAAGWLEVRLLTRDGFPQDDRAVIELPAQRHLRVAVYSEEAELLRPILTANPLFTATFHKTAGYDPAIAADVLILDRFTPPTAPKIPSIWIEPPPQSPFAIRGTKQNAKLTRWHSDLPLGAGIHTGDLTLASTQLFAPAKGDISIADVEGGPVILARPTAPKLIALGFNPVRSALKYELATPLLFANIFHWLAPDIFRQWELNAGSVGAVNVKLDKDTDTSSVHVIGEDQRILPFTIDDNNLRFFSGAPGVVRVLAGDRELVYSLTLPNVGDASWAIPASANRGLPRTAGIEQVPIDLWQWLALLGGLGLLADWIVFGKAMKRYQPVLRQALPWKKAS